MGSQALFNLGLQMNNDLDMTYRHDLQTGHFDIIYVTVAQFKMEVV